MTESDIRLSFFLGIFTVVMLWEFFACKRKLNTNKSKRWFNNIALVALDTLIVRLLLPAGAVGIALWADESNFGLLHLVSLPVPVAIILSVIILDLVIYWQHRMFHQVPLLWRLHQVHHADCDIDVTTALRFHPIEILISMLIKFAAVLLIGAPALAVVFFEVVLNGMAMFNHGNIRLPKAWDALLRIVLVTPDMHRVHHSVLPHETNSNYGFNISLWDKLFSSYHAQPDAGHDGMTIGLNQYQHQPTDALLWMLRLPLNSAAMTYAKNNQGGNHE